MNKNTRNTRAEKDSTEIAYEDELILPYEKWLAAFVVDLGGTRKDGNVFLRQFHASGFYEAYAIVASYAERLQIRVLWFQEKRSCGISYSGTNYMEIESQCTYCNDSFNGDDIPCPDTNCSARLCSKKCLAEHNLLKRSRRRNSTSFK